MKDTALKSQAVTLIQQIEQQRAGRTLMLNKLAKTQSTTDTVLNAAPELQVAFVEAVVEAYAVLGTPKGKKEKTWFYDNAVPSGSAAVVNLLFASPTSLHRCDPRGDFRKAGADEFPFGGGIQ